MRRPTRRLDPELNAVSRPVPPARIARWSARYPAVAEVNSLANTVKLYMATETTGILDDDFQLELLLGGDDPYLNSPEDLIDPWGNEYVIYTSGDLMNQDFDVVSYGPDGNPGGDDDIIHGKR